MRGLSVPSFYKIMTFKEKVNELITEALLEKPSIFLIDLAISDSFKISVGLDGDNGVALQDCIDISRAIENNLDREEQDFSLEVASVGVGSPLKMTRQYKKNVGRTLIVTTKTEKINRISRSIPLNKYNKLTTKKINNINKITNSKNTNIKIYTLTK